MRISDAERSAIAEPKRVTAEPEPAIAGRDAGDSDGAEDDEQSAYA